MITAFVQFRLPQPITREKAQEIFLSTAPKYRETPGLIRRVLRSLPGRWNGGRRLPMEVPERCGESLHEGMGKLRS